VAGRDAAICVTAFHMSTAGYFIKSPEVLEDRRTRWAMFPTLPMGSRPCSITVYPPWIDLDYDVGIAASMCEIRIPRLSDAGPRHDPWQFGNADRRSAKGVFTGRRGSHGEPCNTKI